GRSPRRMTGRSSFAKADSFCCTRRAGSSPRIESARTLAARSRGTTPRTVSSVRAMGRSTTSTPRWYSGRPRRGRPEYHRGVLVVLRPMARTLETVLGVVPRDRAAKVRALSIRGDDPARRVQQKESAFAKEDRPVIRRGERP